MPATSAGMTAERWFDPIGTRSNGILKPGVEGFELSPLTERPGRGRRAFFPSLIHDLRVPSGSLTSADLG
jgi:hypothetical protein